jgi:benzoyl-CoA reductase/2-hydroxyglutaryl-CoA dehydratase subunit BcrC/BadD/HgdB
LTVQALPVITLIVVNIMTMGKFEMKTPREKYYNDPEYNHLVTLLERMIESAHFTPSELREACILASINYEMRHVRSFEIDPRVKDSLRILDNFLDRQPGKRK